MKVAIEITEAIRAHRGWGRFVGELAQALVKIDRQNKYAFFYHSTEAHRESERTWCDRLASSNVTLIPVNVGRAEYDALEENRQSSFVEKLVPDADVYHAVTEFPFYVSRIPKITTLHEISPLLFPWKFSETWLDYFFSYMREARSTSEMIVTVSENTRIELIEWMQVKRNKVKVIPNGVSPLFFSQPTLIPERRPDLELLYVGPVEDPLKNFESLWSMFLKSPLGTKLHLVSSDTSYERLARERNIPPERVGSVRVSSGVADQELFRIYQQASVLVFPSLHEGFGLPALEAMAVGLPVVCNGHSGLGEATFGLNFSFSPHSHRDLWRAVCTAAAAPSSHRELGRQRAAERTWERAAEQYIKVYERAARARGSGRLRVWGHAPQLPAIRAGGSFEEIGRRVGTDYGDSVLSSIDYCSTLFFSDFRRLRSLPVRVKKWLRRTVGAAYWFTFDPETRAFIWGLRKADAKRFSFLDLAFINAYPDCRVVFRSLFMQVFRPIGTSAVSCGALCSLTTSAGETLAVHGRHLDHDLCPEIGSAVRFHTVVPQDGFPFAYVGLAGTLSVLTGINSEGLSVSEIGSPTLKARFCRPWGQHLRRLLQKCRSADAADAHLLDPRLFSYSHRITLVSSAPSAKVRVLEVSPQDAIVLSNKDPNLVFTCERPESPVVMRSILAGKSLRDIDRAQNYWDTRFGSFERLFRICREHSKGLDIKDVKTWLKLVSPYKCIGQLVTDSGTLSGYAAVARADDSGRVFPVRDVELKPISLSDSLVRVVCDERTKRLLLFFPRKSVSSRKFLVLFSEANEKVQIEIHLPRGRQVVSCDLPRFVLEKRSCISLLDFETKEELLNFSLCGLTSASPLKKLFQVSFKLFRGKLQGLPHACQRNVV
ncbi:MAG: glycosyltransferase family 4 protein [Bdellovibrionaceae bacterium]|nr:glycosyltransferase family 4 protein [Bdellovibrionales bacterium]MCB9253858.1 glycosyltransferase family 4 protein [Pseudobdellovibrionaceae bacterium]